MACGCGLKLHSRAHSIENFVEVVLVSVSWTMMNGFH